MVLKPEDYTVAWFAPLEIEAKVARHMLDHRHQGVFAVDRGDDYVFQAGDIAGHNVVIATLPAGQEYGTGSAAALAGQVKKSFPNLRFGLLVGVAAGLPKLVGEPPLRDIRLGDVLVALPQGDSAGLVAYDLGKETAHGFEPLRLGHSLAMTETIIRSAIGNIKLDEPHESELFLPYYDKIKGHRWVSGASSGNFMDPGQGNDVLYDGDTAVRRPWRFESERTRVWYGPIGSGEKLMRRADQRNQLRDRFNIIGLEMEAAGTVNRIPVGVIRGVCDYGDERKNKEWQPYAAAMAGAFGKAVLYQIPPPLTTAASRVSSAPINSNPTPTPQKTEIQMAD
ncbi:Pfs, NACHT and WD domain protein [Trichoderma citrinoviride]|uniref:Pfs, NACHT and WD domain protein n=1 Tax=Trichoderma citrinoviride TaxID=58853 RepID=A0A2T4B950_9HYPO|nr:Pfs, NACHT and WD domain protein [Trichoderma citrinoviride]PTB65741.1 Pfs, NACHT and WD domain protein [Trichoderma citrinoviride]